MKIMYKILGFICAGWAVWSLIRFLFLAPSTTGNNSGWEWILSIIIELALAAFFFSLAEDKNDKNY